MWANICQRIRLESEPDNVMAAPLLCMLMICTKSCNWSINCSVLMSVILFVLLLHTVMHNIIILCYTKRQQSRTNIHNERHEMHKHTQ